MVMLSQRRRQGTDVPRSTQHGREPLARRPDTAVADGARDLAHAHDGSRQSGGRRIRLEHLLCHILGLGVAIAEVQVVEDGFLDVLLLRGVSDAETGHEENRSLVSRLMCESEQVSETFEVRSERVTRKQEIYLELQLVRHRYSSPKVRENEIK